MWSPSLLTTARSITSSPRIPTANTNKHNLFALCRARPGTHGSIPWDCTLITNASGASIRSGCLISSFFFFYQRFHPVFSEIKRRRWWWEKEGAGRRGEENQAEEKKSRAGIRGWKVGGAVWIGREATTAAVCDENGWLVPADSSLPLKSCFSASVERLFPADGGRCYAF